MLVKPDGVARGLSGEIIRRIEAKGYRISALRMRMADPELLAEHYAEHVGKPFYQPLVEFMLSGPVVALVAEGHRVIVGVACHVVMGAASGAGGGATQGASVVSETCARTIWPTGRGRPAQADDRVRRVMAATTTSSPRTQSPGWPP